MKALLATGCTLMSLFLGGCATPQYTAEDLDGRVVCDEAKMRAVEHDAQRRFADVHWVRCPTATLRVVRD